MHGPHSDWANSLETVESKTEEFVLKGIGLAICFICMHLVGHLPNINCACAMGMLLPVSAFICAKSVTAIWLSPWSNLH